MLDENELGAYIDRHFTSTLFRLETHDLYDVSSNGDDFQRYLAGEPGPDMHRKGKWLDHIRGEVARGLHTYRVHIVRQPLTDYLRYEFEWDYVHNAAAGEHIRILDLTGQTGPEGLVTEDFWLIDEDHAVAMRYDDEGRFQHGEVVTEGRLAEYRRARDTAWAAAVPFADYWREHPQYWRDSPAI